MSNITPTLHSFDDNEDSFFEELRNNALQNSDAQEIVETPNENNFVKDLQEYDGTDEFYKFLKDKTLTANSGTQVVSEQKGGEFNLKDLKDQNPVKEETEASIVDKVLKDSLGEEVIAIPEEAYAIAFDFIRENGILNIPEDVELNAETLPDIIAYDQNKRNNQAFEYIKSLAGDEHVVSLLELVINGGTFEDMQVGKEIISDEIYFQNADPKDEATQRSILKTYLSIGLDPKIPSHRDMLEEIPSRIDNLIGAYKSEAATVKAIEYFLNDIQNAKVEFENSKRERIKQEEAIKAAKIQREMEWRDNFLTTLKDRDWTNAKKNEVYSQFNTVELTDGSKLPLWDYKMKKIWEDPKLTQVLFRFLSDFDEHKKEFKNLDKNPTQIATSKILEMANKKAISKTITNHVTTSAKPFSKENLGEFIMEKGAK